VARGWIYWTWLIPACLAIGLILVRRHRRVLLAAVLLFALPLLPVLGLRPFMFQYVSTVADHYLYLSMLGPALLAVWVIDRWPRALRPVLVLLLLLLVRT